MAEQDETIAMRAKIGIAAETQPANLPPGEALPLTLTKPTEQFQPIPARKRR